MNDDKILSVSEPKVMQSAAGYYIGLDCEVEYYWSDGTTSIGKEPYDRLSGYFAEKALAEAYLLEVY
jgi:hypothetical protein